MTSAEYQSFISAVSGTSVQSVLIIHPLQYTMSTFSCHFHSEVGLSDGNVRVELFFQRQQEPAGCHLHTPDVAAYEPCNFSRNGLLQHFWWGACQSNGLEWACAAMQGWTLIVSPISGASSATSSIYWVGPLSVQTRRSLWSAKTHSLDSDTSGIFFSYQNCMELL